MVLAMVAKSTIPSSVLLSSSETACKAASAYFPDLQLALQELRVGNPTQQPLWPQLLQHVAQLLRVHALNVFPHQRAASLPIIVAMLRGAHLIPWSWLPTIQWFVRGE